jgi:hypothetical protein
MFYRMLGDLARLPVEDLVSGLHAEMRAFLKGVTPDGDISLLGVEYTGAAANHYTI